MIQVLCNKCDNKINQESSFFFEATIVEIVTNLENINANMPKTQQKKVIHLCEECYKKIKDNLYGTK